LITETKIALNDLLAAVDESAKIAQLSKEIERLKKIKQENDLLKQELLDKQRITPISDISSINFTDILPQTKTLDNTSDASAKVGLVIHTSTGTAIPNQDPNVGSPESSTQQQGTSEDTGSPATTSTNNSDESEGGVVPPPPPFAPPPPPGSTKSVPTVPDHLKDLKIPAAKMKLLNWFDYIVTSTDHRKDKDSWHQD
jgi:hypothetical protein